MDNWEEKLLGTRGLRARESIDAFFTYSIAENIRTRKREDIFDMLYSYFIRKHGYKERKRSNNLSRKFAEIPKIAKMKSAALISHKHLGNQVNYRQNKFPYYDYQLENTPIFVDWTKRKTVQ